MKGLGSGEEWEEEEATVSIRFWRCIGVEYEGRIELTLDVQP